jgi:naphthalene 1,2-dioxygenase system ferredoxin subunit
MNHTDTQEWVDIGSVDDVPDNDVFPVMVNGRELALYGVNGQVYVTDNLCTHGAAKLSDGFLEGHEIECPFHQGRFDICTGKALCEPLSDDLKTYTVRIENMRVMLRLD